MGLPYTGGHAGQILFGPADGHLYLMTGDGTQGLHSTDFAQNKRSLLGKILRVDVDNMPSKYGKHNGLNIYYMTCNLWQNKHINQHFCSAFD